MGKAKRKLTKVLHTKEQIALQEMLRSARIRTNMTQEMFAEVIGKPQSFVSKYERGDRMLNPIELIVILRNLNVSPVEFISELDEIIADDADW